jgi:hypothetical protein
MSAPSGKNYYSLLLSLKANAIGHSVAATRGRFLTTMTMVLSVILSTTAGSTGFLNLANRTWSSATALAAALSSALAIVILREVKTAEHMRAQADYEDLYLSSLGIEPEKPDDHLFYRSRWDRFQKIVHDVNVAGIPLTARQVKKSEAKARKALPNYVGIEDAQILKVSEKSAVEL